MCIASYRHGRASARSAEQCIDLAELLANGRRTTQRGAAALASVLASVALSAPVAAQTPVVVEQFGSWSLYADLPAKTVCFIAAPASETTQAQPVLLYVSAWPKDGIKSELSVKTSGKLKKGATASITVGSASFRMFSKDDRAFVDDPTQELKLIEAMKKGAKAVVRSEPELPGGGLTDTFGLTGFAQALQELAKTCP